MLSQCIAVVLYAGVILRELGHCASVQSAYSEDRGLSTLVTLSSWHKIDFTFIEDNSAGIEDRGRQTIHLEPVIGNGVIGFTATRLCSIRLATDS